MDKQAFNYAFDLGIREIAIELEKQSEGLRDRTHRYADYNTKASDKFAVPVFSAGMGGVGGAMAAGGVASAGKKMLANPKYAKAGASLMRAGGTKGKIIGAGVGAALAGFAGKKAGDAHYERYASNAPAKGRWGLN